MQTATRGFLLSLIASLLAPSCGDSVDPEDLYCSPPPPRVLITGVYRDGHREWRVDRDTGLVTVSRGDVTRVIPLGEPEILLESEVGLWEGTDEGGQ